MSDALYDAAVRQIDRLEAEVKQLRTQALRKRPIAWMRYVNGDAQFQHASDDGDPPEDQGWIALYRRGGP